MAQAYPAEDVEVRYRRQREELLDSTRRYARSMSEAFADERAPAIHLPRRRAPLLTKSVGLALLVLIVVCAFVAR